MKLAYLYVYVSTVTVDPKAVLYGDCDFRGCCLSYVDQTCSDSNPQSVLDYTHGVSPQAGHVRNT